MTSFVTATQFDGVYIKIEKSSDNKLTLSLDDTQPSSIISETFVRVLDGNAVGKVAPFKAYIKNYDDVEKLPSDCSFQNINEEVGLYGFDAAEKFEIGVFDVAKLLKFSDAQCFDGRFIIESLSAEYITASSTKVVGNFDDAKDVLTVQKQDFGDLSLG